MCNIECICMFIGNGHLSIDPWIWLKLTSLSSTASVLRECKISLKFQEFFQKFVFSKHQNKVILAFILLILRLWVVLKTSVASMTSTDMITSLASMTSTASLASKNQKQPALYILSDFPGIRNLSGLNDLYSLNNLGGLNDLYSLISSKKLLILMIGSFLAPKWPIMAPFCGMYY